MCKSAAASVLMRMYAPLVRSSPASQIRCVEAVVFVKNAPLWHVRVPLVVAPLFPVVGLVIALETAHIRIGLPMVVPNFKIMHAADIPKHISGSVCTMSKNMLPQV